MTEATVEASQVQSCVSQAATVSLVPVAFPFVSRQNESIEVVQETVGGQVNVLDPDAVQVVQVVLRSGRRVQAESPGRRRKKKTRSPTCVCSYGLGKIWVELQHVVDLLLQGGGLQRFVLIVLQEVGLETSDGNNDDYFFYCFFRWISSSVND